MPFKEYEEISTFDCYSADIENIKGILQAQYREGKALRFTHAGYPPFTPLNGQNGGSIMHTVQEAVRKDLNIIITDPKTSWVSLREVISQRRADVALDPVMFLKNKNITIVPYAELRTNVIAYNAQFEDSINPVIQELSPLVKEIQNASSYDHQIELFSKIVLLVDKINHVSYGFSVTEGVKEEKMLLDLHVSIQSIRSSTNGITKNIVDALQGGYIAFADYPSIQAALSQIEDEDKSNTFYYADLFGADNPSHEKAGFAFNPRANINLQKYFLYHTKHRDGLIRRIIDEKSRNGSGALLDKLQIKIIHDEEIVPLTPTIKKAHNPFIGIESKTFGEFDVDPKNKFQVTYDYKKNMPDVFSSPIEFWKAHKIKLRTCWQHIDKENMNLKIYLAILNGAVERERRRPPSDEVRTFIDEAFCKIEAKSNIDKNDIILLENSLTSLNFKMPELPGVIVKIEAIFGVVEEIDKEGMVRIVFFHNEDETYFTPIERVPIFLRYYNAALCWINRFYLIDGREEEEGRFEPGGQLISSLD